MGPIEQLRYVRLGTRDLPGSAEFVQRILGLQPVARSHRAAYFRSDHRDHTLVLVAGDPTEQAVGFEIHGVEAFEAAIAGLERAGTRVTIGSASDCDERKVRRLARFGDSGGNMIEIVVRPQNSGWRFHPTRDSGVKGLAGVSLRTTSIENCERLWTRSLGAQVTDRAGDAVFLGIDSAHHRLAYYPSAQRGILAVEYEVESVDLLMQGWYFLQGAQVRIVHGPGRRPTSSQLFVTCAGPDGVLYSLVAEGSTVGPSHRPRQFAAEPASFCSWGSPCEIPELRTQGS